MRVADVERAEKIKESLNKGALSSFLNFAVVLTIVFLFQTNLRSRRSTRRIDLSVCLSPLFVPLLVSPSIFPIYISCSHCFHCMAHRRHKMQHFKSLEPLRSQNVKADTCPSINARKSALCQDCASPQQLFPFSPTTLPRLIYWTTLSSVNSERIACVSMRTSLGRIDHSASPTNAYKSSLSQRICARMLPRHLRSPPSRFLSTSAARVRRTSLDTLARNSTKRMASTTNREIKIDVTSVSFVNSLG